jgi:putative peptidoglycan lipid II flippase
LIAFIFLFADQIGVWALVISVPISFFVQWLLLYSKGKRYGELSIKYGLKDDAIKTLIIQATPILISQATVEINQVVDRALLSSIGEGTLTAVSYSAILFQFASQLITAPLATVMFTELSEAGASNDDDSIRNILNGCYRILILVCTPIILLIYWCGFDIVDIVYGHGNYSHQAVIQSAIGLKMYGFSLLPVGIKTVLSRAYYAKKDTLRPMVIGIIEVSINIFLSIILVKPFGIWGVVGATSIASIIMIIVMLIDFNRKYICVVTNNIVKSYWKILSGLALIIVNMKLFQKLFFVNSVIDFILKSITTFVIYGVWLFLIREQSINSMIKIINSKIKKKE